MQHAWLAAPLACALVGTAVLARHRWPALVPLDRPDTGRKDHATPMPLAGLALLPFLAAAAPDRATMAATALACACGFLDDRAKWHGRGIDWRLKAALLGATSLMTALATVGNPAERPLAFALAALFAFVVTNAVNFLDCMDGVCLMLCATILLLVEGTASPFALAGFALVGALPWNWPRPRMFLGDAGALAAGTLVASACLHGTAYPAHVALPAIVPLTDFVQVVAVRLTVGQAPWVGDKRHLPHRLAAIGLPRALVPVALALSAATFLLLA